MTMRSFHYGSHLRVAKKLGDLSPSLPLSFYTQTNIVCLCDLIEVIHSCRQPKGLLYLGVVFGFHVEDLSINIHVGRFDRPSGNVKWLWGLWLGDLRLGAYGSELGLIVPQFRVPLPSDVAFH